MSKFYTNVACWGDNILYRGVKNGKRVSERIKYSPKLFLISPEKTNIKTLDGKSVKEFPFDSIKEARDFSKKYEDVPNFELYGNTQYEYTYIADEFPNEIAWNINDLIIATIDIEVGSENGFPDSKNANEEITAITLKLNGKLYAFGCGEFHVPDNLKGKIEWYMRCNDEINLIKEFLQVWIANYPDIITGWYTKFFDIPYLVNRITKLMGEKEAKKLSPWNMITEKSTVVMGKELQSYNLVGISMLDYMELFRKFSDKAAQESYKLDHIAFVVLGEKKLDYSEYDNLHQLYKQDFQKFMEYNIRDVLLIDMLDKKEGLLSLAITAAYYAKANFDDVFMQVRMWDCITYNFLRNDNVVIPQKSSNHKSEYDGGYVKEPIKGKHEWIVGGDFTSLYPRLIITFNISPETLINHEDYPDDLRLWLSKLSFNDLLSKKLDTSILKKYNYCLAPNGSIYTREFQGFLPKIMQIMFDRRVEYKNKMKDFKKELEKTNDPKKRDELEASIAKYNNLQLSTKIALNSAYGAMGSPYFRFYNLLNAAAVTLAGQLSIQWVMNVVNNYLDKILGNKKDRIVASDTDSMYLTLVELVSKVFGDKAKTMNKNKIVDFLDSAWEEKIGPVVNKSCEELVEYMNAYIQALDMKREAIADIGIWTGKKHYILNVYDNERIRYKEPQIKVVGLEMVKSSTPTLIRNGLKDCIKLIVENDESKLHAYIEEFREKFKKAPIEDISFPRGMNGLLEYKASGEEIYRKGTPIHVRASLLYNYYLKLWNLDKKYPLINDGEKIKFVYLKLPNKIKENVIAFSSRFPTEFMLESYIDYNLQFEKTFLNPLDDILQQIEWTSEPKNTLF